MSDTLVLARLRLFLLGLAGFLFVGTLVELVFTGHTDEPIQWVPFFLCGAGLAVVIVAIVYPSRSTLRVLKVCMIVVALGSLLGVYEHIQGNVEFRMETHPNSTTTELMAAALGGADPLVAPGILAVAGVLALAATYRHPGLNPGTSSQEVWPIEKRVTEESRPTSPSR
jgi:hypothetical protein